MKRITMLSIAMLFMYAVFTTAAMAASFDVTANYGVRVAEKGVCEQVGAVTLAPQDSDVWAADTVITVELLAQAMICKDVSQYYALAVSGYTVVANTGDDFITITIDAVATAAGETIRFGHDALSSMCFDLSGTPYNSTDPNLQMVQISFRDDQDNTYSGDTNVATVKPQQHSIAVCTKDDGELVVGANGWPNDVDVKTGLIQIPLCDPAAGSQEQGAECGCDFATEQICIRILDPGNQITNTQYNFTITTAKAGVGISGVAVWTGDPAAFVGATVTERRDIDEVVITDTTCADYVATKAIDFNAILAGAGTQYIVVDLAYDSCVALPGELIADVSFSREPCGDSYSVTDLPIANMTSCGAVSVTTSSAIFPYAPDFASGVWWVGLALTNPNASEITVELDIYEADGDLYKTSVTVPGCGITTQLAGDLNPVSSGSDAEFGDERFWINATSNGSFTGFLMMGDGTQAQGYLPLSD